MRFGKGGISYLFKPRNVDDILVNLIDLQIWMLLLLTVLDIRDAHAARVYEKQLVLVRPGQHVA